MRAHRSLILTVAAVAMLAIGAQAATGGGDVVVRNGDTLSAIAARNGVSTAALASANGITDINHIEAGQVLHMPGAPGGSAATYYTARSGDTLASIGRYFGVSVSALASANAMPNPNLVRIGQRITIPARPASGSSAAASGPRSYTVRSGDTLSSIGRYFGVSTSAIASANHLANQNLVRIGQVLAIPAGSGATGTSGLPATLLASPSRLALRPTFEQWAATYGVPADLLEGLCWLESGWQNGVVSSTGAIGIGQLMPDTVSLVNDVLLKAHLSPNVAAENIRMSARFLKYLLDRSWGDVHIALAAYYQGFRSVSEHGVYAPTLVYVAAVLALRDRF